METTILIGGPWDGHEITEDYAKNDYIRMPVRSRPSMLQESLEPSTFEPMEALMYRIVVDELGFPSRDDQGRLRHRIK